MKTKIIPIITVLLLSLTSASAFAANPYGIDYTGGEILGEDNVQIDPTLINELTQIPKFTGSELILSDSTRWQTGYVKTSGNSCRLISYFKISDTETVSASDNLYFTIQNGDYHYKMQFTDVVLDDLDDSFFNGKSIAVIKYRNSWSTDVSLNVYSDPTCSTLDDSIITLPITSSGKFFLRAKINLYKNQKPINSDQLYLELLDVDAAQSFKILNPTNLLSPDNMYAKSAESLQPSSSSTTPLRNRFNASENYIYSEYQDSSHFATTNSNVFVKLDSQTQTDGLDIVFGFKTGAGSGVLFYTKMYEVVYSTDKNGEITGAESESTPSGTHPSGTTIKAADGYELKYWTADKDVKLSDGKIIASGQPITPAQFAQIAIDSDITFTAIHGLPEKEPDVLVPNTGSSTSETNAALVFISVFGVLLGALMISILPKLHHKKVNFKQ